MKGIPMVLWTCDRCGTTEHAEPTKTPTHWWTWTSNTMDPTSFEREAHTYEVCDECDSIIREVVMHASSQAVST